MKKTIYYCRHGETEWNKLGRFQGHSDISLNATGIQQALQLQTFFSKTKPELFISSDLIRAKQTTYHANLKLQKNHLIDPRLREVNLGQAEGKTLIEVKELWGEDILRQWQQNHFDTQDFRFPGGESKRESIDRVQFFLKQILLELPYQIIAVIGHGGTLRRLCEHITQDPSHSFPIPNCCVYELTFDCLLHQWEVKSLVHETL